MTLATLGRSGGRFFGGLSLALALGTAPLVQAQTASVRLLHNASAAPQTVTVSMFVDADANGSYETKVASVGDQQVPYRGAHNTDCPTGSTDPACATWIAGVPAGVPFQARVTIPGVPFPLTRTFSPSPLVAGKSYTMHTGASDPGGADFASTFTILENTSPPAPSFAPSLAPAYVVVWHGVGGAPAIDVTLSNGQIIANALPLGQGASVAVEEGTYTLTISRDDTGAVLGTSTLDLTGKAGQLVDVLASGQLDNTPAFLIARVEANGTSTTSPVGNEGGVGAGAAALALRGVAPNPVRAGTEVVFDLARAATVGVEVFDVTGRRVLARPEAALTAGRNHRLGLDAVALAPGVYLYRVTAETDGQTHVRHGRLTVAH